MIDPDVSVLSGGTYLLLAVVAATAYLAAGVYVAERLWPERSFDTLADGIARSVVALLWWQVLPALVVLWLVRAARRRCWRRS